MIYVGVGVHNCQNAILQDKFKDIAGLVPVILNNLLLSEVY